MQNENIIKQNMSEYENFLSSLHIHSSLDINLAIKNNKIDDIIHSTELRHTAMIKECCQNILSQKECKFIFVTGPSSSGKTTFANRLCDELKQNSISTVNISLDHYYKPLEEIPLGNDGKADLEDIEAFEYELLNSDLSDLAQGKTIYLPHYDFEKRIKTKKDRAVNIGENELILVEGIQAFNPKIANNISQNMKYSIYCCALNSLTDKDGFRISSETTRLMRRMVRDYYFRSADCKLTFELWENVKKSSIKHIYPYTEKANYIFNSAAPYEYSLYKTHLELILKDAIPNSDYTEKVRPIISIMAEFNTLSDDVISNNSIIKEFLP